MVEYQQHADYLTAIGMEILGFYIPFINNNVVFIITSLLSAGAIALVLEIYHRSYTLPACVVEEHTFDDVVEGGESTNVVLATVDISTITSITEHLIMYHKHWCVIRVLEYLAIFVFATHLLGGLLAYHYMSGTPLEHAVVAKFSIIALLLWIENAWFSSMVKSCKIDALRFLRDRGVGDILLSAIASGGGAALKNYKPTNTGEKYARSDSEHHG